MSDAVVALERAEIEAFTDLYRAASPDVVEAAGLAVSNVGGVVVLAASRLDVLALNRALGLGLNGRGGLVRIRRDRRGGQKAGRPACAWPNYI